MPDEAVVAEAGGMGAPTVGLEKLDAFETEPALRAHSAAGNSLLMPGQLVWLIHAPCLVSCIGGLF